MKAPARRAKSLIAFAAGLAAVALLITLAVFIAPRLPRVLTEEEVTGTWTSDEIAGVIMVAEGGQLTITNLAINPMEPHGTDSDFDAKGTWTLSDKPNTLSIQLTEATEGGEATEFYDFGMTLDFNRGSGEALLYVVEWYYEQPYYFTREAS